MKSKNKKHFVNIILLFFLIDVVSSQILSFNTQNQNICNEIEIINLNFLPETEWGNLLIFEIAIPDTSIYAPYFFLSTDDEFIEITDSVYSYFWITGPTIIDPLYRFTFNSIPVNYNFNGEIYMESGDNLLNCLMPFEFLVNIQYIIGDLNFDNIINIIDILILINFILLNEFNINADINNDQQLNVLDILQLVDIILN